MNIFEGSRRVARVVAGLGVLLMALIATTTDPSVHVYYQLSPEGLRMVDECGEGPSTFTQVKAHNLKVWATVCGIANGPNEIGLPEEDVERLRAVVGEQRREYYMKAVGGAIAGLIIYWLAVITIGWIVRGFMGIPRGHDRRTIPG